MLFQIYMYMHMYACICVLQVKIMTVNKRNKSLDYTDLSKRESNKYLYIAKMKENEKEAFYCF